MFIVDPDDPKPRGRAPVGKHDRISDNAAWRWAALLVLAVWATAFVGVLWWKS